MTKFKAGSLSASARTDENKKSAPGLNQAEKAPSEKAEAKKPVEAKEKKSSEPAKASPSEAEELKRVQALADDYYSKLQRLQADFDNFRKRSVKEKADVIRYATENLILDLLPVIDNFERALEAAVSSKDIEVLTNGLDMIYSQLWKVLVNEGVEVIDTQGKEFDPSLHEALFHEEVSETKPDMILQEFEKGYRLKDKVIRYSKVKVSS